MEKRSIFNHNLLPYALLLPQIVITIVFFYWPASQAVWQSFLLQDAFGLSTKFVAMENYRELFADASYYRTIATTLIFSGLVALL
ncbi:MAG: sn-glycerol 3-phosphate transport system permease protein, partial [Hyphomicrobiales bacterium]|nr:sn-glycerol 3-phosphate transport system permease protein [Hyphomicrobiales bacterium]